MIVFFITAYLAEVVGTVAGFGAATVLQPMALFFFDFNTTLVLVAFAHVFGTLNRIGNFRKKIDLKLMLTFGIPSVIFTLAGAMLVKYVNANTLKLILGVFLIGYALMVWRKNILKLRKNKINIISGGAASGFLAGLIGTGGALRGAVLNSFDIPKEVYISTSAVVALAVDLSRIPVYLYNGYLSSKYYVYLPVLLIMAALGSYTGKLVVKKAPQEIFRKVLLIAIMLAGMKFVYDYFMGAS